jgi:hypothetical protein|nr:hypothetical protein [uncultured Steroidobacter sp.]
MTIHGLNSIASAAIQVGAADAAGSRVGQETKVAPATAATSAPGPAAIYHPSKSESPSELGGLGDIKVYSWDSKVEENERMLIESMDIWIQQLPAVSAGLRRAYDTATADLSPELLKKDWGFSVSNGELIVLEGSDALSDGELATLKLALTELTPAANAVAETTTRMIVLDRGTYGFSNRIGRFDVSTENFADVVDLRKYLLAHGPNGKYNQARDPSDLESVFSMGGWAIMDQIEANAAVRFSIPKFPF